MPYYVYVLLCENDRYYTGYTKDLEFRVKEHMNGHGSRYTKGNRPKNLVYSEEFETKREAMFRERKIKRLSHDEKRKLIGLSIVGRKY